MKTFDIYNDDYINRPYIHYMGECLFLDKIEKISIDFTCDESNSDLECDSIFRDSPCDSYKVDILYENRWYSFNCIEHILTILRHIRFNKYPVAGTYDVTSNEQFFDAYEESGIPITADSSYANEVKSIVIRNLHAYNLKDISAVRLERNYIVVTLDNHNLDYTFNSIILRGSDFLQFILMLRYDILNNLLDNIGKYVPMNVSDFIVDDKLQYIYSKSPMISQDTFAGSILGPTLYIPEREYDYFYPVIPLKDITKVKLTNSAISISTTDIISGDYYANKNFIEYLIGECLTTKYWNILDDNGVVIIESTDIDSWDEVFSCCSKTSALESLADN